MQLSNISEILLQSNLSVLSSLLYYDMQLSMRRPSEYQRNVGRWWQHTMH